MPGCRVSKLLYAVPPCWLGRICFLVCLLCSPMQLLFARAFMEYRNTLEYASTPVFPA